MIDTQALFLEHWDARVQENLERSPGYKLEDYTVTGRAPAPYGKRTLAWWREQGHVMVDNWVKWRLDNPAFVSWETPDAEPAIELELRFTLPGDIPVLAFVDNLFVNTNTGEIVVIDKKTGRAHETPEQLGLYATGIELVYGKQYRPTWGYWWSASTGKHSDPMHLDMFTPEYLANVYADVVRGINSGCFPAKPQNSCSNWCSVQRFCAATGGVDAAGVDPLLSI